jgi:electron transport complex protein RnfG
MDTAESKPLKTVLLVAAVAACAAALVTASYEVSRQRIAAADRARLLRSLNSVLPPAVRRRNPNPVRLKVSDAKLLGSTEPVDVFVALENGRAIATVFAPVAPNGYNGPIKLLVGVSPGGVVTGVRAVSEHETPGLGDQIDIDKSDWILQFDGKSLGNPAASGWAVDKDGGSFDSITGATITPRAVVEAVKNTLLYFRQNKQALTAMALRRAQRETAGDE